MAAYQAAVFDLDGTLLNTLDDLAAAVNAALTAHGMPPRTRDEVRTFVGNGVAKLIARAVPTGTDEATLAAVFAAFREHYAAHNLDRTAPYAGVLPMLTQLHAAGVKIAIVTNKLESATERLQAHFFADTVDIALGDIPDRPRKPAPDSTSLALARLGVSPDEAVFIGDSDVDVLTAKNAGMPCIAVTWGFRDAAFLRDSGATTLATTPAELTELILKGCEQDA